ncbi:hypothetical protein ACFX1R_042259 [Malus domestica]
MYQIKYPAPGSPHLSNRVKQLLTSSGFGRVDVDTQRGLDHGSWVPQSLRPSFSLSLSILLLLPQSLDPSPVLPPPPIKSERVLGSGERDCSFSGSERGLQREDCSFSGSERGLLIFGCRCDDDGGSSAILWLISR